MADTNTTALRILAWLSLLFLIVVTVGPIGLRPLSGLSVHIERFGAFAVVGIIFALAYPRHLFIVAFIVIVAAISLEALQLLSVSRHGRLFDLVVKITGAMVGFALGSILPQLSQSSVRWPP